MKSLFKISKLKLVGLVAFVPLLIAGTVVAYNIATPSAKTNNSVQTEQATASDTDRQTSDDEQVDETPTEQTATESTSSTQTQASTSSPTTSNPTAQTNSSTTPQHAATAPAPTAPTCNESMKLSYTSLYNSKVNAENASWYNQINAWNTYASEHGMAFSGYTQSMIDQYKPAHDARLAQLQTQYHQNLASVNCNP